MKTHIIIYFLGFLLCFAACKEERISVPALENAEALMESNPHMALTMLEGLADSVATYPEEARMYYQLLTIQAKDKLYITHTSDSLINRIVEFYEDYDDKERLMLAYYYQGSVYRDMNDAPRALKAFQQATDMNVSDYSLLAKTYNQMGTLFMYQDLYDEAIQINRKAIEAYLSLGKRNKISYAQRDIARMYDAKNMPDSALHYYKEACNTALLDGDSARYYGILSELGSFLYQSGNLSEAKQILKQSEHSKYIPNKAHIYSILGHIYNDLQSWDSSYYYKTKVLENGNMNKVYSSYVGLSLLERKKGNHEKAFQYLEQALKLNDSIQRTTQTEAIAKINSLYNYQHIEKENVRLASEKDKQKIWIFVMLFSLLCILFVSGKIIFYQKRKREQDLSEAEEKRKKEEGKRKQQVHNEAVIQWSKEQKKRLMDFKKSEIYKEILQAAKDEELNLTPLQQPGKWVLIQENIDFIYSGFTDRLHNLCPSLSDTDIQVCYLSKIGVGPSGIARILKRSRQAITNIRKRIMQKIGTATNETSNFDHFIEEF